MLLDCQRQNRITTKSLQSAITSCDPVECGTVSYAMRLAKTFYSLRSVVKQSLQMLVDVTARVSIRPSSHWDRNKADVHFGLRSERSSRCETMPWRLLLTLSF